MEVPSRDCTPRALPRASRSGRHGPVGPRNDKSESFTPQNAYRKSCQSAWRSASALYRGIKPQEGTGAPRAPLTCHCEERSDVAISQYPAASWESYRRKRNCLPEIATSACGLLAMTNRGGHPRFIDGPLITPVQRREGTARPLQGACGRRGRSVILGCAWRSLSAATYAIGACRFNGTLFQSFVQRRERHAAPLQGACGRRP